MTVNVAVVGLGYWGPNLARAVSQVKGTHLHTLCDARRDQLERVGRRVAENHRAVFSYDESVINEIAGRCEEVESGARNIDHILTRTLLPEMSNEFLARMATEQAVARVHVGVGVDGQFSYVLRFRE